MSVPYFLENAIRYFNFFDTQTGEIYNQATKMGWAELDDSVRIMVGRVSGNQYAPGNGIQFRIFDNVGDLIESGKLKFLQETVKDLPRQ